MTEQTPTEASAEALEGKKPESQEGTSQERTSVADDLGEILAGYKPAERPNRELSQPQSTSQDADELVATLQREVQDLRAQVEARDRESSVNDVITSFTKEVGGDEADAFGYLSYQAREHPEIDRIFQDRERNPAEWRKVRDALQKGYRQRIEARGRVDRDVTADKEAVRRAAAGSQSNTNSQPKGMTWEEVQDMPQDKFNALQRKLGAR